MKCHSSTINRIKRTKGQMDGIIKMMESDAGCMDLVTQLKSVRANIDKTIGLLTTENLVQTIEAEFDVKLDNIDDAIDLIVKGK